MRLPDCTDISRAKKKTFEAIQGNAVNGCTCHDNESFSFFFCSMCRIVYYRLKAVLF